MGVFLVASSRLFAAGETDILTSSHKDLYARFLPASTQDVVCRSPLWETGVAANFTNTKGIDFALYGDSAALEKVQANIKEYGGNVAMNSDRLSLMVNYFDTNTELYHSMMNRVFACSLIQSRAQVYKQYLHPSSSTLRLTKDSRFLETLKALNEKNTENLRSYGCTNIGNDQNA